MLKSGENGALGDIEEYEDTTGIDIVKANIKEVVIQGSVTSIGRSAFQYCDDLHSVTIGDSVTSIGNYAFGSCSALQSVTIPDSVDTIGSAAFGFCSELTDLTIGDSVTSIGAYAFAFCKSLQSVTIPDSVTSIGLYAFESCSKLMDLTIGNNVTRIGNYAFFNCKLLQSVTIPDSVTGIGNQAFHSCKALHSVTIGDSVQTIGEYAFYGCSSLENVTIGDSVRVIGDGAFVGCIELKSVTLPDSVNAIVGDAFWDSGLKKIYVTPNNKMIKNGNLQFGTNKRVGEKSGVNVISSLNLNIYTYPINGNIKDFEVKVFDSNNNEIPNLNTITNLTNKNGYYKFSFVKPEGSTNKYDVKTTTKDDNDNDIIKQAQVTFTDDDYEKTVYVGSYSDFLALCKKEIKKILQNSDNENVKQLTDEQIDELISEELSVGEGADSITLFELTLEMYIKTIKEASKDQDNDVENALKTVVENFLNSKEIKTLIIQTAEDKIVNSESNGLSITSKNQLDTIASKIRSEQIISALVGLTSTELGTPFDANTIDAVVTYGDGVYDKMKESLDSNPTLTIDDKITSMSKVYTASVTKLENDDSDNGVPSTIPTDQEIAEAQPIVIPSFNPRPELEPQPEPEPEPDMTQEITVAPGWNWISFYLRQDDNSLNNIQLTDFNGDQVPLLFMKDQNNFSEYYGENTGWFGALTEIDVKKTFLFKNNGNSNGKLTITGQKEDIIGIRLETGWNWIGYPRSEPATLWTTTNPSGLLSEAKDGDFIKDQNNFATYYDGLGWFGALTTLEPGKGYFYKSVEDNFLLFYDGGEFIPPSNSQSLIKEAIKPEDIVIDVNKVKSQTFKLLNKSAYLYKGDKFLNEINISRIDEDNARILCVTDKDCSVYANYKSKSEDIYGTERPLTLEMITNHNVYGSKLSILKLSQHGDLKNGNTEIYANNKGLIYIHRGILYQNIPVYLDIKFDYNVETQEPAELTILIYLTPSYTSEILLGLLYQQVTPSLPTELLLQNEVIDGEYRIRINFLPGIEINDLLETGLSFLYNNSVEKKGIELVLKDSDSNAESTSITIDTLNDPRIIYTTTKEDGIDENTLPDVTTYTIDSGKIVYNSNTTGNAGEGPLAEVFKNGVTIEYESIENVHELAMQASGDREYPLFIIDGDMPDKYKIDENDSTSTQERLNQVPFGIGGYINIVEPKDPADKDGKTELFWAAHDGDLSKVQKLLNEGANVNQRDNVDYSPLYWAAHNGYDEVVKVLLENGAVLNLEYKNDWSSLYWASHNGHEKVVALLLNNNVDVNLESTSGRTALHWATVNNHLDEVKLLVEAGAQLNKDKDGYTALDWAKIKGYTDIIEVLEKL